jgi:hypothetical protein
MAMLDHNGKNIREFGNWSKRRLDIEIHKANERYIELSNILNLILEERNRNFEQNPLEFSGEISLEMILLLRATVTNKSSQMISIEEIYKP